MKNRPPIIRSAIEPMARLTAAQDEARLTAEGSLAPDIPPALNASEWRQLAGPGRTLAHAAMGIPADGGVLIAAYDARGACAELRLKDVSDLAALIALANAALPDEDPRKFTWETVDGLRRAAAHPGWFGATDEDLAEWLGDFADVIASYLPPRAPV